MRIPQAGATIVALISTLAFAPALQGQEMGATAEDLEAITMTALDYIEGWYEADPERMARAVHDDLAKRIAREGSDGTTELNHMGKETLVDYTRRNKSAGDVDLRDRVKILDVYENAAVVRVDADRWVDFLDIAKLDDGWVIVNVLWAMRPAEDS